MFAFSVTITTEKANIYLILTSERLAELAEAGAAPELVKFWRSPAPPGRVHVQEPQRYPA